MSTSCTRPGILSTQSPSSYSCFPSLPSCRTRPVSSTGRRYRIIVSGTYYDDDKVEDVDNNEDIDKDEHCSPKLFLRDRLIICLNVAVSPPPPPPPTPPTPPPSFKDNETDAVTSYRLMVRVEVKDDMFTIHQSPSPPPPPPLPPHPSLPLDADNVGLI